MTIYQKQPYSIQTKIIHDTISLGSQRIGNTTYNSDGSNTQKKLVIPITRVMVITAKSLEIKLIN
jgi:hypothetical protein